MSYKIINFKKFKDDRGSLIALEANKSVPFNIKRVYYIFDTKRGFSRGFHAHRALKQVVVCVSGSCKFVLDDGKQKCHVQLNDATKGILIESLTWREMYDLSKDCVLMVLASEYYDETDYVHDYENFLEISGYERQQYD